MDSIIKNWSTQIRKGYLDLCILSLIDAEKRSYGFDIISKLNELGMEIKEGTLYPLLTKMTKQNLLKAKWETENIEGHPRKFYSLTSSGEETLKLMKTEYLDMLKKLKSIQSLGGKNGQQKIR